MTLHEKNKLIEQVFFLKYENHFMKIMVLAMFWSF